VLNEDDTKNMLQTVSLVREISQILDLQAGVASLSTGISPASIWDNTQTLEQMVTIHAEFPNAVNHNEIEEAFNTLVNRASQYAGRPRK
jgi:ATP phosphoribosyltransferase